uniref:Uncharacterized protein n=1 Tax=Glossina palpalis gambiensis TaxID=67801 RepID=A0A1B0BA10_9MUSC
MYNFGRLALRHLTSLISNCTLVLLVMMTLLTLRLLTMVLFTIVRVRAHLFSCPRKSEHTVTRKINSTITVQSDLSGDLKIMEEVVVDERNFFINKYRIINEG